MQKYSPISDDTPAMREDSADGSWYWCQDVDDRIDELERALKSCVAVVKAVVKERRKFEQAADDALIEADKALSLMGRES
jgi:hypothetical protein